MILGEDPSWLSLKEVGEIFGLNLNQMHHLMQKHVFEARKLENNVYALHVDHLADVADRISAYRARRPYHQDENVTVAEAAQCLGVSENMVYQLRQRGELDWAQNELHNFITRQSLEQLMWQRGLGKPRLRRII